uniref:ATP synthase complex subunit 8 n=1 Tax=Proteus anguinus TaxID=221568 RepID=C9DHG4_PROAG|nr:ATP synthase F0 subunit 8 [Proteus anguinus]ACU00369.1 ATP synthase F0 subunit 8 [Proteus anguinus]
MPQLTPGPWLMILLTSWLIYFILLMPKINYFNVPNAPTHKKTYKTKPHHWNWPWT